MGYVHFIPPQWGSKLFRRHRRRGGAEKADGVFGDYFALYENNHVSFFLSIFSMVID